MNPLRHLTNARLLDWALPGLLTIAALLFVWCLRFPPMQDYPDWLFQGAVFSRLFTDHPITGYRLLPVPVPNAFSTLFLGLLNVFCSPEVSGKGLLSFDVVLFILGSIYLLNSLCSHQKNPFRYFPFLFVFGYPYFHGNVNYTISLGFLFLAMGYLLRRRGDAREGRLWVFIALPLLVYFAHAVSFFVYCIFAVSLAIFESPRLNSRKLLLGLIPSLGLFGVYLIYVVSQSADAIALPSAFAPLGVLKARVRMMIQWLNIFHAFYPFCYGAGYWTKLANALNLLLVAGISAAGLLWLRATLRSRLEEKAISLTIFICFFLFLLLPQELAGVVRPGERFLYPMLWLVFAHLGAVLSLRRSAWISRTPIVLCLFLILLQGLYLGHHVRRVAAGAEAVYETLIAADLGGEFEVVYESHFDYEDEVPRKALLPPTFATHSPLIRLPYYLYIEQGSHAPIFPTGILVDIEAVAHPLDSVTSIREMERFPSRIVILGEATGNDYIANLLGDHYGRVVSSPHVVILKRSS